MATVGNELNSKMVRRPHCLVSIIISASIIAKENYHKILADCLRSIENNADDISYEIIIVDNIMYDTESRKFIKKLYKRDIQIFPYPFKFNPAKVYNMVSQHADGKYLLFMHYDTIPEKDLLVKLIETIHLNDKIKAVGAKIAEVSNKNSYSTGYKIREDDLVILDETDDNGKNIIEERDAVSDCCMLVEKKAFEEAGGFDDSYALYNSDIDFCLKLKRAKYKCVVNKDVVIRHYGGLTRGIFQNNNYPQIFDDIILRRKWFPSPSFQKESPKELLIIKLMTLGDAVLVTPTVKALRRKYPEHRITLVTCKPWAEIFAGSPDIDELVALDLPASAVKPIYFFYDAVASQWVQKKDWDRVIVLNCLDFAPEYRRTGLHFRDFYAEIAGVYPLEDPRYFIPVSEEHRQSARRLLAETKPGEKVICIHTNGGWALKNWSADRWRKLAKKIYTRYHSRPLLVGGKGEGLDSPHVINLAGKLSLKELTALFAEAHLFIGLDSGPMHMAAAANAPVIAMFSVTHAKVADPNCDNFITIQAPLSCEVPCGFKTCKHGINCTDSITMDTVLKAAVRLLNRKEPVQEHWKGEAPASIFFQDWEWHTAGTMTEQQAGQVLRALQGERQKRMPVKKTSDHPLKVLFQARGDIFSQPGGDTEVMLNLEKHLQPLGVKAEFSCNRLEPLAEVDLVHIFNTDAGFAYNASWQEKPYVVTPMYEDFSRYWVKSMELVGFYKRFIVEGDYGALKRRIAGLQRESRALPHPHDFIFKNAEAIFASGVSEQERLLREFALKDTVRVNQLGFNIPADAEEVSPDLFVSRYGVKDFVLCVGRLEPRKNQLMLLLALQNEDLPLVFVNSKTVLPEYEKLCRGFRRSGKTLFTGRISREMLFSAYKAARVHALPSWYELPGLVSLEAAWFGCRVAASPWGTLRDYLGDRAFYCEPDSPESVCAAVLAAWNTPQDDSLSELIGRYTWDGYAQRVYNVYQEVLALTGGSEGRRRLKKRVKSTSLENEYYQLREKAKKLVDEQPQAALEIKEITSRLLHFRPTDATCHYLGGIACLLSGCYSQAEAALRQCLELQPFFDIKAYLYLSLALIKQKKFCSALELLQNAQDRNPFAGEEMEDIINKYQFDCSKALAAYG